MAPMHASSADATPGEMGEPHEDSCGTQVPADSSASSQASPVDPPRSARELLCQAVEKVMAEIDYHENQAREHQRQAEQLRKELRETYVLLQRGGRPAPSDASPARAGPVAAGAETPAGAQEAPPRRTGSARRRPGRKKRRQG
jgi:hypothetical protein